MNNFDQVSSCISPSGRMSDEVSSHSPTWCVWRRRHVNQRMAQKRVRCDRRMCGDCQCLYIVVYVAYVGYGWVAFPTISHVGPKVLDPTFHSLDEKLYLNRLTWLKYMFHIPTEPLYTVLRRRWLLGDQSMKWRKRMKNLTGPYRFSLASLLVVGNIWMWQSVGFLHSKLSLFCISSTYYL